MEACLNTCGSTVEAEESSLRETRDRPSVRFGRRPRLAETRIRRPPIVRPSEIASCLALAFADQLGLLPHANFEIVAYARLLRHSMFCSSHWQPPPSAFVLDFQTPSSPLDGVFQ